MKIKENADISKQAQQILNSKIGYRCLDQTDDDYHYPKEIINFEMNELGNTDIGDTMLKFYGFKFDNQLHGTCANPGVDSMMIQKLSNWLCKHSKSGDFELVWVTATKKQALDSYSDQDDMLSKNEAGRLEKWDFSHDPDFKIISDLGAEGQLIAYTDENVEVEDLAQIRR